MQFEQTIDEIANNISKDREKTNEYYHNNKEKIIKYKMTRVRCNICDIEITQGNRTNHNRTKFHEINKLKLELVNLKKDITVN